MPYRPGDLEPRGTVETVGGERSLGGGRGHWTRNVAFAPDGTAFYVAVGSAGNTGPEAPPRATVQRFDAGGGGQSTFAAGLRNPVGIAFHPDTGELYVTVNERDGLGDGLVPDYLTRVREGGFFGWPYAYIGPNPDPDFGADEPGLVARAAVPDVLFQSHSAPQPGRSVGARWPSSMTGAFTIPHGSPCLRSVSGA